MPGNLVSIHVPARGTTMFEINGKNYVLFQSTFPRGERLPVSMSDPLTPKFQSTFPRGERPIFLTRSTARGSFNPRSREGNDFFSASTLSDASCFNPRSREGNDDRFYVEQIIYDVSIHVPARGTTIPLTHV